MSDPIVERTSSEIVRRIEKAEQDVLDADLAYQLAKADYEKVRTANTKAWLHLEAARTSLRDSHLELAAKFGFELSPLPSAAIEAAQ